MAVLLLLTSMMSAQPVMPEPQSEKVIAPMATLLKPEGTGPFPVGSYTDTITPTTKTYSTNLIVFYPATANGTGTSANMTKAPYPTIIFLPFFGGNEQAMAGLAQQMSSWGLVVMTVSVNWTDFPNSCNVSDMEDFLDYLEAQNATPASSIYKTVDKEAFGLSGYSSGGGLTIMDATYVDRIKAVQTLAAAIGASTVDFIAPDFHKPILLQVGKEDSSYIKGSQEAFKKFDVKRSIIEIIGASHGGPFVNYLFPAFYLYQFNREPGYRTYLYGAEAVRDNGMGVYDLYFNLSSTEFFPPKVTAWASKSYVNMDDDIVFNGTITGYYPAEDPQGQFEWDFYGDGSTQFSNNTVRNTTFAYPVPGQYAPVFQWRMGMFKVTSTVQPSVTVNNILPVAGAGPDQTVKEDQLCYFDSYESYDSPSDWLMYSWAFGDGSPVTGFLDVIEVNHTFTKTGNYTVTLTVKDGYGATATDKLKVNVENVAPRASITALNHTGQEDVMMEFKGLGNDTPSDRSTLTYMWDLGDTTVTNWDDEPNATHTFTKEGNYTLVFSVKDNNGVIMKDTGWVNISNVAPIAGITSPEPGSEFEEDIAVEFQGWGQDSASDAAGLVYKWEFGDATSTEWGSGIQAAHTYNASGTYNIKFYAKDEDGAQAMATTDIIINNLAPKSLIGSPLAGTQVLEDETVAFSGSGTDTLSDVAGLEYKWTIDGQVFNGQKANYSFKKAGTYDCVFNVTDTDGASDLLTIQVKVTNKAPVLTTVIVEPLKITNGGSINFSATGTDTASDIGNLTFDWTFGDGTSSKLASGTHTYTKNGTFKVEVVLTDDEGASVSKSFSVIVEPPAKPIKDDDGKGWPGMMAYAAIAGVLIAVIAFIAVFFLMKSRSKSAPKESDNEKEEKEKEDKEEE